MVKKRREDYVRVAEFKAPWTPPGLNRITVKITILVDLEDLLEKQGPLVIANQRHNNKQTYGPFRVTIKEIESKEET
jgi:hypothetical protein